MILKKIHIYICMYLYIHRAINTNGIETIFPCVINTPEAFSFYFCNQNMSSLTV